MFCLIALLVFAVNNLGYDPSPRVMSYEHRVCDADVYYPEHPCSAVQGWE